ncbi:MAG TPA: class A beta-lactamase [Gemmatimonadales bacterium]|nr:class A beta-lactamase [Gemmatimonadales bacterium]
MQRRDAVAVLLGGLAQPILLASCFRAREYASGSHFATIEQGAAGRLGVAVLDVAASRRLVYRAHERFPMCSTFKWLLAAQVLSRVDAAEEQLSRVVPYGHADLLDHAPVTRAHVHDGGMTVEQLTIAAIQTSDNTAANLLLRTVGGPASFTAFLRRIGDRVSRLDRIEPELNSAEPGDVRDTTTPSAMLANIERLILGNRLHVASRERLVSWLLGSTTGGDRLRAGVPSTWRVADKTGTGAHGATNDVAIMWPPGREPVLVAAYLTETDVSAQARNSALAAVGREVASWVGGS